MKFAIREIVDGKPVPVGMFDTYENIDAENPVHEKFFSLDYKFSSEAAWILAYTLENEGYTDFTVIEYRRIKAEQFFKWQFSGLGYHHYKDGTPIAHTDSEACQCGRNDGYFFESNGGDCVVLSDGCRDPWWEEEEGKWKPLLVKQPPVYLYSVLDAEGQYLYVGISLSVAQRMCEHRHNAKWWGEQTNIKTEAYPNRASAIAAEKDAIAKFKPRYNVVGNGAKAGVSNDATEKSEAAEGNN
jgi:hypothetical protein